MSKRRKSASSQSLSKQALVREAARRKHDNEFDLMNERKPAKRVKPAPAQVPEGGYLTDAARGMLRRVARMAMAPLALARAFVDRFRSHEAHG